MKPSDFPAPLRAAVQRLMTHYGWALLDEAALCYAVWQIVGDNLMDVNLPQVVTQCYAAVLYDACRQSSDQTRRSLAYTELHSYLYHNAKQRDAILAADIAQTALELVYTQIERCQHPQSFFTFAFFKLLQVLKEERRRKTLGKPVDIDGLEVIGDPEQQRLFDRLYRQEGWELLLTTIRNLHEERSRATIFLKYFEELDDEEIGRRLDITPNYVRVLRTRALGVLRRDPNLLAYFRNE